MPVSPLVAPSSSIHIHALPDCDVSDIEVEEWHKSAQAGHRSAKKKLYCWVYATAQRYFHGKLTVERSLSREDAEELTSEFFVEFERAFPAIRTVTRFTRRALKNKLLRYIEREKSHRGKELIRAYPLESDNLDFIENVPDRSWESWSDIQWYQYATVLRVLNTADEITREVISQRLNGASYKEISVLVELSESALRMRVARFYAEVRRKYRGSIVADSQTPR